MKTDLKAYGIGVRFTIFFISFFLFGTIIPAKNCQATTSKEDVEQLIEEIINLSLHKGFFNCLDAKLNTALRALNQIKSNNNNAAINSLKAFKRIVELQVDRFISYEDAINFTNMATRIIYKLGEEGCPLCGCYPHIPPCTGI